MTPTSLSKRAEELADNLYCTCDKNPCDVQGKILAALRQTREEALEEAAKVAEETWNKPFPPANSLSGELVALRIRDAIHALASGSCSCDPKALHAYGPCPESGEGK
jgi:hypothetical protein